MKPGFTLYRRKLLAWYRRRRRDLPWRSESPDPYRILVSEIMLQQTTVRAVTPIYERFLEIFPSLEALADAGEDEVLAAWAGLGYYRRARMLHQAAKEISARPGGWPVRSEDLQRLPGVGHYTAAAVASIAFGEVVPVLDGNVARVITRWRMIPGDYRRVTIRRQLLEIAGGLLSPRRPGDSNQAMMELGAMICHPKQPDCSQCPIRGGCLAYCKSRIKDFPTPMKREPVIEEQHAVLIIQDRRGRYLLERKTDKGALQGLWCFPMQALSGKMRTPGEKRLGTIRHSIMNRKMTLNIVKSAAPPGDRPTRGRYVAKKEIGALPRSSIVDKILRLL